MSDDGGFIRSNNETKPIKYVEDHIEYCSHCKSNEIDNEFYTTFNLSVCYNCKWDKHSLITKTECIKEYLLSKDEIKNLKYLVRPNPHKGSWNNMNLYLKNEIENLAIDKYGTLEKIKELKNERKEMLIERKKRRFKKKVRDLKKRTRLKIKNEERHIHEFISINGKTKCECGMEIEQEEF
ncbi:DNA repair protein rad14 [Astathelohania contejeani]|uniref:DNA repair protein rad14 n=1 Tax=Astathelohania contejeani TaxID=164912 RepID=A0ABQ7I2H5_9MICR|nr:DNA repair protein rad14 [Thelohania contejeani]